MRLATVVGAALVASGGCNTYYAPPIRAVQYGAPARLEAGRVEVGGTAGGFLLPDVGGPHIGVGIRDWVALEAGGNLALDYVKDSWALAWLGPRFSYAPHRERRVHLISDLELGVGVGVGGVRDSNAPPSKDCTDCDGRSGWDRIASGGYAGVGIGAQIAWFSVYARTRLEASTATNVPTTLWPSASVGIEFNVHKRAAITLGGGYIGYVNRSDQAHAWFYQLGVTLFFDAFVARRPSAAAAPTPEPTPPRPTMAPPRPTMAPPPPPVDDDDRDEPFPDACDCEDDPADRS